MNATLHFQTRPIIPEAPGGFRPRDGVLDLNGNGTADKVTVGATEEFHEPMIDMERLQRLARKNHKFRVTETDMAKWGVMPEMVTREKTGPGAYKSLLKPVPLRSLPQAAAMLEAAEKEEARLLAEEPGKYTPNGPLQFSIDPEFWSLSVSREVVAERPRDPEGVDLNRLYRQDA